MSSEQTPDQPPRLSLVAQFDDMCRLTNSLISLDEGELVELINNLEKNRLKWLLAERQLFEMRTKIQKLEEEKKTLSSQLQRVRFAFGSEVQKKEEILKQKNALNSHLNAIKEFILEDPTANQSQDTKDKVLSYFINRLETVKEENASNDSLSGLEYDTTEEDILDESMQTLNPMNLSKRSNVSIKTSESQLIIRNPLNESNSMSESVRSTGNEDQILGELVFDTNVEPPSELIQRNRSFSEPIPEKVSTLKRNPVKSDSAYSDAPPTLQSESISISSSHINISNVRSFLKTDSQKVSTIDRKSLLEERKHQFHQKKAFKPLYCGPCGKAIGFCGTCLCCGDCRGICHISCKDKLPLPCIPFRKPNGKSSQMALIADFAPQNTRPMIPALIIHCCNEIEKRGLNEEGLYRKCGSDKEVRELKEKILKSKSGIPMLAQYDVHVLCGVVKQFLRQLDEPIITRILWRDFSRAADQENPFDERALTMKTVDELPTANRDSLAFLMVHLLRVARNEANLMDVKSLAKIFGPIIVSYSMIDPPLNQILAENPKQIKVVKAFMRIPEESWNEILSTNNVVELNKDSPNRRQSFGSRTFEDVRRGTLSPQRSSSSRRESLSLKPLF